MSAERWLLIPGWTQYEVSDFGRVRRIAGKTSNNRGCSGRILKAKTKKKDDVCVQLYEGVHKKRARVAHLVLLAFVGPAPLGMECCHFDDEDRKSVV